VAGERGRAGDPHCDPLRPAGLALRDAHPHQRDGLDWNNFYAAQIYQEVAYHEFEGITVDPDEKPRLIADLGTRRPRHPPTSAPGT
jgi:hypothetical protein